MSSDSILHLDTVEDLETAIEFTKDSIPLVVKCGAAWCAPCKRVAPAYKEFSKKFKANFASVDIDDEDLSDEVMKFGMTKIPYFIIFKGGKHVPEGLQHSKKEILQDFLSKYLEPSELAPSQKATEKTGAKDFNEKEVCKFLEDTLSNACESIRNTYKVDFDEQKALHLLQQTLGKLQKVEESMKKMSITSTAKQPAEEYKSKLPSVESAEQWEKMIQNTKSGPPLVIDCWKSNCAPCKRIAPEFDLMESEFKATFAKVNVDDEDLLDFALTQGLTKLPFFIVFKNGSRVEETLQNSDPAKVRDYLTRSLKEADQFNFDFDEDF